MENQAVLEEIIKSVLGKPKLKYNGGVQLKFDCPVCSLEKGLVNGDGKANLEVNLEKQVFKCWACSDVNDTTHGSVKKLITQWGTVENLKLYNLLFSSHTGSTETKKVEHIHELPKEFLPIKDLNKNRIEVKQVLSYLETRKITEDIIEKYNIGVAFEGPYKGRIILPSYDKDGNINYFVSRAYSDRIKPKYKNPKADKEQIIFNEKFIDYNEDIYIVEGPFDHIITPNSIPLLGKRMYDMLWEKLYENAQKNIIIALDPDAKQNSIEIFKKLNGGKLNGRIKFLELNKFDLSDLNQKIGSERYLSLIKEYRDINEFEIK